jgi:cytidylate kinase
MEREHLSQQAATSRAKDHEKGWSGFHRSVFKADVYDNRLYDLIINTGRLPLEAAAESIATAARQKEEEVQEWEAKSAELE